jgi:hypothetical protein
VKLLQFMALTLSTIALAPAGAHLFSLPNKIHMAQHDYFIVQTIYNGWAILGVGNLITLAGLAIVQRAHTVPFVMVLISLGCQLITLAIFLLSSFQLIRRQVIGLRFRLIGNRCVGSGNTGMLSTRSSPLQAFVCWRSRYCLRGGDG